MDGMDRSNQQHKIPKIIHYCWFGGKPIPEELKICMDSWKKLDGYTIMRWDESNCSLKENKFVQKAYKEKKMAYVSDYYRLLALYEYGGIYLDTDVKIYKSLDELLKHKAFFSFIFESAIGSAIIGAQKGSNLIKQLIDMYDNTTFGQNLSGKLLEQDGDKFRIQDFITNNYYITYCIIKNYPKFKLNNKFQDLGDFAAYPKEYFEIGLLNGKQYTIHFCSGVWRTRANNGVGFKNKLKNIITSHPILMEKVQILLRKRRYKKINKQVRFYDYSLAQKRHRALPEF